MKNLFIGAGLLLGIVVALFLWLNKPRTVDPAVQRIADLTDIAERTCLVNKTDNSALSLRVKLEAVKSIDGSASIEQQRASARGAAQALVGELQNEENREIRVCMEPWSKQLQELASKL